MNFNLTRSLIINSRELLEMAAESSKKRKFNDSCSSNPENEESCTINELLPEVNFLKSDFISLSTHRTSELNPEFYISSCFFTLT